MEILSEHEEQTRLPFHAELKKLQGYDEKHYDEKDYEKSYDDMEPLDNEHASPASSAASAVGGARF